MLEARAAAAGADSRWAVVVDETEHLLGWIDLEPGRTGTVEENLGALRGPGSAAAPRCGRPSARCSSTTSRWIPVVDGERYLGVLTPNGLHAAMRRSVGGHAVEG